MAGEQFAVAWIKPSNFTRGDMEIIRWPCTSDDYDGIIALRYGPYDTLAEAREMYLQWAYQQ